MDRLWVYTSVRDEEEILPFFLKHYSDYADRIIVQDCGSQDGTKQLVKLFGADLIETEPWGMDEVRRRNESHEFVINSKGKTEWCACVDADEFLLGDFDLAFDEARANDCDILQTIGWTMTCDGLPKYDGSNQLYQLCDVGISGPGSAKPCIAMAGLVFTWSAGRHFIDSREARILCSRIHLLHYRWMGYEYTKKRNERNYARSPDKSTAWACSDWYKGPHSTEWSRTIVGHGVRAMPEIVKTLSGNDHVERYHNGTQIIAK